MRRSCRLAAALVAVLLVAAGCRSDDGPEDVPPIGGEDADEVESATEVGDEDGLDDEDPYAVPDEIDEAYAERVINRLLEIDAEALLIALEQEPGEPLDIEAEDRLAAILAGHRHNHSRETMQAYVDDPNAGENFLPPDEISASRFEVDAVLHAEPERCVIVAGWWDLTTVAVAPFAEDRKTMISLSRLDREVTSVERNPTPWQMRDNNPLTVEGEPIPEEDWPNVNLDPLDHTCKEL